MVVRCDAPNAVMGWHNTGDGAVGRSARTVRYVTTHVVVRCDAPSDVKYCYIAGGGAE